MVCIEETGSHQLVPSIPTSCIFYVDDSHCICSRVMWDYLEHIAFVLSNIVKVLRVMPHSEAKLMRRGYTRRYTSSVKQRRVKLAPHTASKSVPFVTGDDGKLLPGVYVVCVHFCLWLSFSQSYSY